jgi:hypothetical protein
VLQVRVLPLQFSQTAGKMQMNDEKNDPEPNSVEFRGVPRVPVATVKAFDKLKTVELIRLRQAVEAEIAARNPSIATIFGIPYEQVVVSRQGIPSRVDATPHATEALRTMDTGINQAPARYTAKGRETIDRMRDYCYWVAGEWFGDRKITGVGALNAANKLFVTHCRLTAMKYRDRLGLKEGVTPERDEKAAWFYEQMAAHVESDGQVPDPRSGRSDFQPYSRQEWTP